MLIVCRRRQELDIGHGAFHVPFRRLLLLFAAALNQAVGRLHYLHDALIAALLQLGEVLARRLLLIFDHYCLEVAIGVVLLLRDHSPAHHLALPIQVLHLVAIVIATILFRWSFLHFEVPVGG